VTERCLLMASLSGRGRKTVAQAADKEVCKYRIPDLSDCKDRVAFENGSPRLEQELRRSVVAGK